MMRSDLMLNPKRKSVLSRGSGGKFSSLPKEQVGFVKDLLVSSRGLASYPQVAQVVSKTGLPISSESVRKIAIRNGLNHGGKTRGHGMHFVNVAKKQAVSKYVREKIATAKVEGKKEIFISVNELIGARRTQSGVVSGTKQSVGLLLNEVLKEFTRRQAEVGVKVSRATVGIQLVPQKRLKHNYKVICDFVFSLSRSGLAISPKLLRRVFGLKQSTAEKYLLDMQLDPNFLKRLSVANVKVVRSVSGANKKVDIPKLRQTWTNKIIRQNTKAN